MKMNFKRKKGRNIKFKKIKTKDLALLPKVNILSNKSTKRWVYKRLKMKLERLQANIKLNLILKQLVF